MSEHRKEIPEIVNHDYLTDLLEISRARLTILLAAGAEFCLPGQVAMIRKAQSLAKAEMDGNLLLDAQLTIAESMDQLDYSNRLMKGLLDSSECVKAFSRKEIYESERGFLHELSDALNCQCDQLTDVGSLTSSFRQKLSRTVSVLDLHQEVVVTVHVLDQEDSAKPVIAFIKAGGIPEGQIDLVASFGADREFSEDGLYFDFTTRALGRKYKLKDWRESLNLKSSFIRR